MLTSDIRPTLERKFKPDIEHLLNENRENISKLECINGIKILHNTEVQNLLRKSLSYLAEYTQFYHKDVHCHNCDPDIHLTSPATTTGYITIYSTSAQVAT